MKSRSVSLCVPGFRAAGLHCGVKASQSHHDLALIVSDVPARAAGVFTRSTVVGAPIPWCREVARRGRARAVVVNSGCANVAMGASGVRANRAVAQAVAAAIGVDANDVFVGATGVIGEPLPVARIQRGVVRAASELAADARGFAAAAEAIRTTDTFAKLAQRSFRIGGRTITLGGMTKGSGMIEPNMATMLGYLFTDADVSAPFLRRALKEAVAETFNRVTVDGETSTSDMVVVLANGVAGNRRLRDASSPGAKAFTRALREICEDLAKQIARDGEGATKLVTVDVSGAKSAREADAAARRIANSLLVKTALFGNDPNWGRILQTVGAGRSAVVLERCEIKLAGVSVFARGRALGSAARRKAFKRMQSDEVAIEVRLGAGSGRARIWTCDLSYDYVKINAEYTT